MRSRRWFTRIALAAAAMASLAAIAQPAGATVVTPTDVLGSGSDVAFHIMNSLDQLYNESPGCNIIAPTGQAQVNDFSCYPDTADTVTTENYAHDQVHGAAPIGGSAGVTQLCGQGTTGFAHIDYARQTKAPTGSNCTGLHFVAYARDALDWEAFPGVTGSAVAGLANTGACAGKGLCLTQQQLKGIFLDCSITNWSQVGGANKPIAVYTIKPQYGTRTAWDAFVGGDTSHCIAPADQATHIIDQTDNAEIFANGDAATAIAPVSFGSFRYRYPGARAAGAALGAIDGVRATTTTVGNGSFPFGRFVYNVYCVACASGQQANPATVNYVGEQGWICKPGGQHGKDPITGLNYRNEIASAIKAAGFVPLSLGPIGGGVAGSDFCRLFVH